MSGLIPEELISEVLSRCNIVDVLGDYVHLRKVGNGYQALCPFHHEAKPSFHVNESKGLFHCFGCGAGGNVFHFLMKLKGLTFPEAVKAVAQRVGIEIHEHGVADQGDKAGWGKGLLRINQEAMEFFQSQLMGAEGGRARAYLEARGISKATAIEFSLGWAPQGWRRLLDHLKTKGEQWVRGAETLGLVVKGRDGSLYDRFRERVIFPIVEEDGEVVGFGGRSIGQQEPKYLNSPESPLFSKRKCLYGLDIAKSFIRKMDSVVVVEGYMDAISLHQAGIRNCVATLGTALTRDHLLRLRRFTSNVLLIFDGDSAGERASLRALDLCLETGIWGRVLRLPQGHDPDSFLRERGFEELLKAMEDAIPLMDFFVQKSISNYQGMGIEGKRKALGEIAERLNLVADPIVRDHYVEVVSRTLGISEGRIQEVLRRSARDQLSMPQERLQAPCGSSTERLLLQCMLRDPSLAMGVHDEVIQEIQDATLRGLARAIKDSFDKEGEDVVSILHSRTTDPEVGQCLAELLATSDQVGEDPARVCQDCVRKLKIRVMERKIERIFGEIQKARRERNFTELGILEAQRAQLILEKKRLDKGVLPRNFQRV